MKLSPFFLALLVAFSSGCCCRSVRTAQDITPGNPRCEKLDYRYGRGDIKIQTTKLLQTLTDRWFMKTVCREGVDKLSLIITEVDNRTDAYISLDMVRDIIEEAAVNDGRFSVVVGNESDECELDHLMGKIATHPKYANTPHILPGNALAPVWLVKIRITKSTTSDKFYDYEDYRMTATLYDIETQEAVDTASDTLSKKVNLR